MTYYPDKTLIEEAEYLRGAAERIARIYPTFPEVMTHYRFVPEWSGEDDGTSPKYKVDEFVKYNGEIYFECDQPGAEYYDSPSDTPTKWAKILPLEWDEYDETKTYYPGDKVKRTISSSNVQRFVCRLENVGRGLYDGTYWYTIPTKNVSYYEGTIEDIYFPTEPLLDEADKLRAFIEKYFPRFDDLDTLNYYTFAPIWDPAVRYTTGQVRYENEVYRRYGGGTTAAGTLPTSPRYWYKVIPEWPIYDSTKTYNTGDQVRFLNSSGTLYYYSISLTDNNTTTPPTSSNTYWRSVGTSTTSRVTPN